ncbi:hypothetical protein BDN67DRAFT_1014915 [Paxillus ammoniavirescens]|nr:hypothetical protein BDN67DRAFT_1014915 [Paxillus ammoniavirescens]
MDESDTSILDRFLLQYPDIAADIAAQKLPHAGQNSINHQPLPPPCNHSPGHFWTTDLPATQPRPAPLSPLTLQSRRPLTPTPTMPDYIPWSPSPPQKENRTTVEKRYKNMKRRRSLSVEVEELKPKGKKAKAGKPAPVTMEEAEGGRWSEDDTTKFITEIFENRWNEFNRNRNRVLKAIMANKLLSVPRNEKALSSKYDHLRRSWRYMNHFETWTGNGGGDPDLPEKEIDECIKRCKNAGRKVGTLSANSYKLWKRLHWYEMMAVRLAGHPGTCREDERNSYQLSDLEVLSSATEDDDDVPAPLQTPARTSSSAHKKNMSSSTPGVPVPAHKARSGRQNGNLGGGVGELFTVMTAQVKQQMKVEETRMELLRRKEQRETQEVKFRHAKDILRDPEGVDDQVVKAAKDFMAQYFSF